MGRYSRKDMIEFAKFAKSYQSSRNVEEAYAAYLGGARIKTTPHRTPNFYMVLMGANIAYLDGVLIKSRYVTEEPVQEFNIHDNRLRVETWDKDKRILHLTTEPK